MASMCHGQHYAVPQDTSARTPEAAVLHLVNRDSTLQALPSTHAEQVSSEVTVHRVGQDACTPGSTCGSQARAALPGPLITSTAVLVPA